MDTKRFLLAVLSVGLFLTPAFSQNHQVMEKQFFPDKPITGVIVDGMFSVEYTTGERSVVTVIGDLAAVPNTKVETISQDDGTVFIKVNTGKGKLIVEGNHLQLIDLSGVTSFETKTPIESDELHIKTSGTSSATIDGVFQSVVAKSTGASSIHLTGTAQSIVVDASGVSEVDISKLEYQEAEINATGVSRISMKEGADNKVSSNGVSSINIDIEKIYQNEDEQEITILSAGNVIIKTTESADSSSISFIESKIIIKDSNKSTDPIVIGPYKIYLEGPDKKITMLSKHEKNRFDGHWGGVEIGINGYNTSDFNTDYPQGYEFLDLYFPKSIAFYLNLLELNVPLAKNQKWGMLSGLGFEWHNYRFANDVWLGMDDGALQGHYFGGTPIRKTKLMVSYMTVPLIFEFQTNNKSNVNSFHVGLGVVGGLRIGSHTKVKFEDKTASYYLTDALNAPAPAPENYLTSSKRKMKNHDDFYLNPLKLDATVRVGWSYLNLFATYSLTPMFRENRAPELYPWTVGITLLGW